MTRRDSARPRRRTVWIVLAVIVLGAAATAAVLRAGDNGPGGSTQGAGGSEADVLALSGVDPITGERVSLDDFEGKPIVINVWASWCPGCNDEALDLARLAEEHPEAQVIGLDVQDTDRAARGFYERWGWKHPSIRDPNGELAGQLGLQGLPSTFFLDAEHRLVDRIVGVGTFEDFEAGLATASS